MSGSAPEIRLNIVLLPAPFGPMRPRISPGWIVERQVVDGDEAAELLARRADLEQRPRRRRAARARGSGSASGTGGGARARQEARDPRPDAVARALQQQTIRMPNTTISKLPLLPSSVGQDVLQHLLRSVISVAPTTAPHTLPAPPTTAMNRYSMPWLMPNGVGLTKRCRCA